MKSEPLLYEPLRKFGTAVTAKMAQLTHGEPEEQLRTPFENFMGDVALRFELQIGCKGETLLPDGIGQPDFAVHLNQLLVGFVELKPAGTGADSALFTGRNKKQFERFKAIPNLLYTDGNEWALYRNGLLEGRLVHLSGNVAADGKAAVSKQNADAVEVTLRAFFMWQPFLPTDRGGQIDLRRFSAHLAPLCRMLRDEVNDALQQPAPPFVHLVKDWRQLLFPEATDEQFADAFAQTVLFALLLGRSEGADPLTLDAAVGQLAAQHSLLSRALQVLTDSGLRTYINFSLEILLRVISVVPISTLTGSSDPWLYFYEDFLAVYDANLRKQTGVYYTPVEVVKAQVGLIDSLLVKCLGKPLGFADPNVVTLDPAVGTGTYLLGVVEHAMGRIQAMQGEGAVAGAASAIAQNLYGFEVMVGPYAVSELRVSNALRQRGAQLPDDGIHIYLSDTLESPYVEPPQIPFFFKPLADQHARALEIKSNIPVIVCLGNPPYGRHNAATREERAHAGGWVRYGDVPERGILRDFIDPAKQAGHGRHLKNLYNLYVYFWRWALWKVFEQGGTQGPGIVSFISASSYLDGAAFGGMREHMRRQCDDVWILDLGGELRGTRQSENVFAIQTPVSIAVVFRAGEKDVGTPARVRYSRVEGSREEKLSTLSNLTEFRAVSWEECPMGWQSPFRPQGRGQYFKWPLLTDLMPWQHSGAQFKRTWPIAPEGEMLDRRWESFLQAGNRAKVFPQKDDRKIDSSYEPLNVGETQEQSLSELPINAPIPRVERYAYRSFDRQWAIIDARLGDRLRPVLWRTHSDKQVYLTSLFTKPLGRGPALIASASVPDLDYFSGRGAKDVVPLYRTADTLQENMAPGVREVLTTAFKREVLAEDVMAYIYGILSHPEFTARFTKELETKQLRVPLTKDRALFEEVSDVGKMLIRLHTYGARFVPEGAPRGHIANSAARCTVGVPEAVEEYPEEFFHDAETATLHVGKGQFRPVATDIYDFEISEFKVVQSWLVYRMKKGKQSGSSPLDSIRPQRWTSQFTTELLELLWVLEATLEIYPRQGHLLQKVMAQDCVRSNELQTVPSALRKAPRTPPRQEELLK